MAEEKERIRPYARLRELILASALGVTERRYRDALEMSYTMEGLVNAMLISEGRDLGDIPDRFRVYRTALMNAQGDGGMLSVEKLMELVRELQERDVYYATEIPEPRFIPSSKFTESKWALDQHASRIQRAQRCLDLEVVEFIGRRDAAQAEVVLSMVWGMEKLLGSLLTDSDKMERIKAIAVLKLQEFRSTVPAMATPPEMRRAEHSAEFLEAYSDLCAALGIYLEALRNPVLAERYLDLAERLVTGREKRETSLAKIPLATRKPAGAERKGAGKLPPEFISEE